MTKRKDGSSKGPKTYTGRGRNAPSAAKMNLDNLPQADIRGIDEENVLPQDDSQIRAAGASKEHVSEVTPELSYIEQMEPGQREQLFDAYVSELDLSKKRESDLRKEIYPDGKEMDAGKFNKVFSSENDDVRDRVYDVAFEGATSKRAEKVQRKKVKEDKRRLAARDKLYENVMESVPERLRKAVGLYIQGATSDNPQVKKDSREWFVAENNARDFSAQERSMIENYMGLVLGVERANAELSGNAELASAIEAKAERLGDEAREKYDGGYNGFMAESGKPVVESGADTEPQADVDENSTGDATEETLPEDSGDVLEDDSSAIKASTNSEELASDEEFADEEYDPDDEFNWRDADDLEDSYVMRSALSGDVWGNQRKYYSKTVEEAEAQVRATAKKLGMPELDISIGIGADSETVRTILDTLNETLEETDPGYLSNFYKIKISPPDHIIDKATKAAVLPLSEAELDARLNTESGRTQVQILAKEKVTENRLKEMHEKVRQQVEQETSQRIIEKLADNNAKKALLKLYGERGMSDEEAQGALASDMASDEIMGMRAEEVAKLTELAKDNPQFNDVLAGVMESGAVQQSITERQRLIEKKWMDQLNDEVKGFMQTAHMFESGFAMAVTSEYRAKHTDYPVEHGMEFKAFPELKSDFYKNLLSHEMGHLKSFTWADTLLTNLADIESGGDYTAISKGKKGAFAIKENAEKERGLIQSISDVADFKEFMSDWEAVSMYKKGEVDAPLYRNNKHAGTTKVAAWQMKDDIPKASAKDMQDAAFGKVYASEHHEGYQLGRNSVAEEIAEAYKMYKHPKRNSYLKYLHKSGRRDAARYLEGLMRVIDKYEKKTQGGDLPAAIVKENQSRLSKEQAKQAKKPRKTKE